VVRVDADKYDAMRKAILAVLPESSPGLAVAELGREPVNGIPLAA